MPRYIDFSQKPKEVQLVTHAIGLDNKRPYQRHGKFFYRPYRNYFSTHEKCLDFPDWMELCNKGYAMHRISDQGNYIFWLTRKGLDWLGEELGITIYDEED